MTAVAVYGPVLVVSTKLSTGNSSELVLKGEPALVDSTSPRRGEQASCYSAVCLETGEVAVMELEGNSNSTTSVAFLRQLRARHTEPLTVIGDK